MREIEKERAGERREKSVSVNEVRMKKNESG